TREPQQQELLDMALAGCPREQINQHRRKAQTDSNGEQVRMSKVKIELPGASVVLTGRDLGMGEVVALLGECLKEARKAEEQYDVKTFQSMMKDRARVAGG